MERKQTPFRYDESLEKDIDECKKCQRWGSKKNQAIIHAVQIAAQIIRASKPKKESNGYSDYYNVKEAIEKKFKVKVELDSGY